MADDGERPAAGGGDGGGFERGEGGERRDESHGHGETFGKRQQRAEG